tara:strand:- start:569 stop:1015 length:447 start_codon:yes stop_codon:yes gene_type:complete
MDLRKLKSLIDLVSDSDISELEISEGEDSVRIVKEKIKSNEKIVRYEKSPQSDSPQDNSESKNKQFETENIETVVSPMVGTFYRAPSPESSPFIDVGQLVEEGQTLCVIEAMKLMNEVPSNISGKVLEVLVENGEPVEFEQPLFKIEI